MVRTLLVGVGLLPVLTGCANSGPAQIGPDTYMVANTGAWSWSSGAALKGDLYQQANAFCATQGKQAMPVNAVSNDSAMGFNAPFAHAEIDFRCLATGDPELGRPIIKPAPNVVIESH